MKLDPNIRKVEVFYDGKCGMCCKFRDWLNKQEHALTLVCIPYQADEVREIFPDIAAHDPDKQLVVRLDNGDVHQGAKGWVWCLWSCVKYQDLAQKLNNRFLLPIAQKACYLLSANRLRISQILLRKPKDEFVEMEIEETTEHEG